MSTYFLIEVIITFMECIYGYKFVGLFIGKRLHTDALLGFSAVLSYLVTALNAVSLFSYSTTIFVISFVCMTFYSQVRKNFINLLSLSCFYYFIVYVVDFVSISLMAALIGTPGFATYLTSEHSVYRMVFLVMDKTVLTLLYLALKRIMISNTNHDYKKLFPFTAAGFAAVTYLIDITLQSSTTCVAINWALMLIISVISILLSTLYHRHTAERNELEKTLLWKEYFSNANNEIREKYELRAQDFHDFRGHVIIIRNYLIGGKYDEAIKYADTLYDRSSNTHNWTGNRSFDCILTDKHKKARDNNITLSINADGLDDNFEVNNLSLALDNILNNAIEACLSNDCAEKWISFSMRTDDEHTIIEVVNPIVKKPVLKNNKLLTSKKNAGDHGLGIKSVRRCVAECGGLFRYEISDTTFTVLITLF